MRLQSAVFDGTELLTDAAGAWKPVWRRRWPF